MCMHAFVHVHESACKHVFMYVHAHCACGCARGLQHFTELAHSKCSVLKKCVQPNMTLNTLTAILFFFLNPALIKLSS